MEALGGAVGVAAAQQRAAVAGTFEEVNPAHHLVLEQVFVAERQWLPHEAIDDQGVSGGVDSGNAGVMALEMQSVRGGSCPGGIATASARRRRRDRSGWGFPPCVGVRRRRRAPAIGARVRARHSRPVRYFEQRPGILAERGGGAGGAEAREPHPQQVPAVQQAVAGGLFPMRWLHAQVSPVPINRR